MWIVDFLAVFIMFFLVLPLWVVTIECWIGLFSVKTRTTDDMLLKADLSKVVILIPAYNEATGIAKTLSRLIDRFPGSSTGFFLQDQPEKAGSIFIEHSLHSGDEMSVRDSPWIVVVADNCSDNTAEIARQFNVTVLERQDVELRGKGYALDFGVRYLKNQQGIDVLVVLDADCELRPLALEKVVHNCLSLALPIQMLYTMRLQEEATLKQRIAGFAWLVKNKIRPLAVSWLNLPIILNGTGMAIPWQLINQVNLAHGGIVEDMLLGIDLTLKGYSPQFCPDAEVFSYFPAQQVAQNTQRIRWEHGHLKVIIDQTPRLIKQAVIGRNLKLLALALDIAVPPLALLVLISLGGIGLLSIFYTMTNVMLPVGFLWVSFVSFVLTIFVVWWREARRMLSFGDLCAVPMYIFSKLSVYFSFIVRHQKDWVRTERDGGDC